TTMAAYDSDYISRFYDEYGEREWSRHEATPAARVSFHVHRHYLQQFIRSGATVLEAGSGPGRFTIELAKLGAAITVGDISPTQLDLHRRMVGHTEHELAVVAREHLDITDLSRFSSGSFDAVVCYGGPLSYTLDRSDVALAELLRVLRPGGHLLLG